eukprot:gene6122-10131_t
MFSNSPPNELIFDDEFFSISSSLSPPMDSLDLSDVSNFDMEKFKKEQKSRKRDSNREFKTEEFIIEKEENGQDLKSIIPSVLSENLKKPLKKLKNTVTVYVQQKQKNERDLYGIQLQVNKRTLGIELIRMALIQYTVETKKLPLFKDPDGYLIFVGQKNRNGSVEIDSDMPMMEKSVPILDFGFDLFILKLDEKWKEKDYQIAEEEDEFNFLEYKKLKLIIGGNKVRILHVSPDLFLIDLYEYISKRCNIEKDKYHLYLVIDNILQPISPELKYQTILSSNLNIVILKDIKSLRESKNSWIKISDEQHSTFAFPKLSMDVDSEYNVTLVNKFSKEEIKIGFDSNFIYHTFFKRKLNLLFSTKKEERSISRIISISKIKEKKFFILFDNDEKFQYETKTTIELDEIIKTLNYLLDLNQQKRTQTGFYFRKQSMIDDKFKPDMSLISSDNALESKNEKKFFLLNSNPLAEKRRDSSTNLLAKANIFKSIRETTSTSNLNVKINHNYIDDLINEQDSNEKKRNSSSFVSENKLYQKNVKKWTNEDVLIWLTQIGFPEFKEKFKQSNVDGDTLIKLTLNDLKEEFNLTLDPRKKLYSRINDLKVIFKIL